MSAIWYLACLSIFLPALIHYIQLVAKLKSIFDRFDSQSNGRLNGAQIEQMLIYMNRPVESVQVRAWLQCLKEKEDSIEFPEFVAQYSVS